MEKTVSAPNFQKCNLKEYKSGLKGRVSRILLIICYAIIIELHIKRDENRDRESVPSHVDSILLCDTFSAQQKGKTSSYCLRFSKRYCVIGIVSRPSHLIPTSA